MNIETSNNNDDTPQTEPVLSPVNPEIEELKKLVLEHAPRILIGICIGLLLVGAVSFYKTSKGNKLQKASALLASARSPDELQAILTRYPSSPAAPLALLKLAKAYYNSVNYDNAIGRYSEFIEKYPEHQMKDTALMGMINCTEAKGMTEKALWDYIAFLNEHPESFLATQALFGKARCMETLDRKEEAKQIYEEFIASNPDSGWVYVAEDLLTSVKKELQNKQR